MILRPAPRPCESCPYRQDVPSGVWAREEYEKLPAYDRETPFQPFGVFMCHQQDSRVCAGWAACHDMVEMISLRVAAAHGLGEAELHAILDYETDVPVFTSGTEAAAHGLGEVDAPGYEAIKIAAKILRRRDGNV